MWSALGLTSTTRRWSKLSTLVATVFGLSLDFRFVKVHSSLSPPHKAYTRTSGLLLINHLSVGVGHLVKAE